MEPNREVIEDLTRRQGYTEEEAEVAYHLARAENLLLDLLQGTFESGTGSVWRNQASAFRMAQVDPHFRALFALLDRRVLRRDYPESEWRLGDPRGESSPHYD